MEEIKLLFSGDFAPVNRVEHLGRESLQYAFSAIKPVLDCIDLHITNLECPLTKTNKKIKKIGPTLKANPQSVSALMHTKVNIACLANNHIKDYYKEGIKDTIETCKSNNIETLGAGMNIDEASRILIKKVKGIKLAFINCCESEFSIASDNSPGANPADPVHIYSLIEEAKLSSDFVIVIFHGGIEYLPLPSIRIKNLFHFFAKIGASAVIGHHTHTISGYEIYNDIPLVYGLGNFIFDEPGNQFKEWFFGLFAELSIEYGKKINLKLHPIKQNKNNYAISLLKGRKKDDILKTVSTLSHIITNDYLLIKNWEQIVQKKIIAYQKALYGLTKFQKILLKLGLPLKRIVYHKRFFNLLNIIQNESHRDISIFSLKSFYNDCRNS